MKKLILLLPFLFLFFQKINAQDEPRLVKRLGQTYSDSLNTYIDFLEERYEYDERGNKISDETIYYDIDGDITGWTGLKYDYDNQNRLIKESLRKYNWEVGLWIVLHWMEIIYDNDGCIKERLIRPNRANDEGSIEKIIAIDAQCRETEIHTFQVEEDTLIMSLLIEVEYDDDERSELRSYYDPIIGFDSPFYEIFIIRDEYGDEIEWTLTVDWFTNTLGPQTYLSRHTAIEYIYDSKNEKKESKKVQTTHLSYSQTGELLSTQNTENVYHYSCDELIMEESEDISIVSSFQNENQNNRYEYIYAGEDKCIELSNHLNAIVYPNPTSGNIEIESDFFKGGNTLVQIFDISGKILLEKSILFREVRIPLDVGDLPNGVYTLRMTNGEYFLSEKIVVVK